MVKVYQYVRAIIQGDGAIEDVDFWDKRKMLKL